MSATSSRDRSTEQLLADLFVFAPLGLLLEGPAAVPVLVKKGRQELSNARVIGSFVTPMVGRKLRSELRKGREAVVELLTMPRTVTTTPPPGPRAEDGTAPAESSSQSGSADDASTEQLPIAGYNTLPSSAIVELLVRLTPQELLLVREYEARHRQRATILTRSNDLLAGPPQRSHRSHRAVPAGSPGKQSRKKPL